MIKYYILFCMMVTGFHVFGQNDTIPAYLLDEVVVTTQRSPKDQILIPYSINSLNRRDFEIINPRTTPEFLMSMNGVFVQKTNHGGGSPFIRGLTGNQTLLLIDGIRLNNSTFRYGPNQYLNTVDPYNIEKIEVARGTGSVQYGTDAIGGALQLFTREPVLNQKGTTWHGKLLGKYMTGGMEKTGRGELSYVSEKVASLFGFTYRNFGDIIGGKHTGIQSPSGYIEYASDAKLVFALNKEVQITLASQFLQQQNVPVYHKIVLENYGLNEINPQQRMLSYVRLNLLGQTKFFSQVRIITSWQQNTEGRNSQKNGTNLLIRERDEVNTLGLVSEISSGFSEKWRANSGIEIYHDNVGSTRREINASEVGSVVQRRGLYPDNSGYTNFSVYTMQHFNPGKWIFDGGIRFSSFRINITDNTLGNIVISPEAFIFNAAVMYNFDRNHHVYTAFSNGLRAPNIDDLGTLGIVDFRYEVPAYDLEPERSQNFELGYKHNSGKLSGTFAAYYMKLNQLITRIKEEGKIIDGYQVYRKENVEEGYIQGVEGALNWKVFTNLEVNSGMTWIYGQSITRNEPLRRIPPFNGRVAGICKSGNFSSTAEFIFAALQNRLAQGDKSDNRIPAGGTPGWQVLNLMAGYRISSLKFNAGLQNLFNEDYRTHGSGINGVGRSVWIAVNYDF